MRHLLTGASLALTLAIGYVSNSFAHAPDNEFDAADRFTSRELLEKSDRDQRLWLSGIVVGMSVGVASIDVEAGECIIDWYFEDEDQVFANTRSNMERFPDHAPAIIVLALARRSCPALDQYRD